MFVQAAKILFVLTILLSVLVYEISSGVLYGIRIPDPEPGEKQGKTGGIRLKPEVDIKQGTVEGTAEVSRNGRTFLSFKGIPYGKVPQRFNNAVPADPWKGKRSAKEFGPACAQVNLFTYQYSGVEDCLSLNVYVPKIDNPTKPMPVMFFIYGGAFMMGDNSADLPHYFMDEDVIIVSPNYRLSAFGFLNAGVKGASGNQAFKDLVLALKWVQENIPIFGGDPKKVTIFGASAGAAAVSHLVASPMASGLFSGAIAQSGAATIGWAQWPDPEFDEPKKLAIAVDCPTSNREFMVECLRKIRPDVLAQKSMFKDRFWFERSATPVFGGAIETFKESPNDPNVFLSEPAEKLFEEGRQNKVPFMAGVTSHEGLTLHAAPIIITPGAPQKMNEQWGRIAPEAFFYWSLAKDPCRVSAKLRKLYFQDKNVSLETFPALTNIYTDGAFAYPVRKNALRHSRFAPMYLYNFTKEVQRSFIDAFGFYQVVRPDTVLKPPAHGDDLQFTQNTTYFAPIPKDSPDYDFSVNMVKLWTSFAKEGKPNYKWGMQITGEIPAVKDDEKPLKWLILNNELSIATEPEDVTERMEVLDEICRNELNYCVPLKK